MILVIKLEKLRLLFCIINLQTCRLNLLNFTLFIKIIINVLKSCNISHLLYNFL